MAFLKCRLRTFGLDELSQVVEDLGLGHPAANRQGVAGPEPVFQMLVPGRRGGQIRVKNESSVKVSLHMRRGVGDFAERCDFKIHNPHSNRHRFRQCLHKRFSAVLAVNGEFERLEIRDWNGTDRPICVFVQTSFSKVSIENADCLYN